MLKIEHGGYFEHGFARIGRMGNREVNLSGSKGILLLPLCLSLNLGGCLLRMIIWWRWVFSLELRV